MAAGRVRFYPTQECPVKILHVADVFMQNESQSCLNRYWNPGEEYDFVGPCLPKQRCIGGQLRECALGYTGAYCSRCEVGFFLQTKLCVPCGANTTTMLLYIACAAFAILFTLCVFLLPVDVMNHIFGTITMLQTFRGLGTLGSTKLPPFIRQFYATLGLFTLDFEFNQPGCYSTKSDYVSILQYNTAMLGACLAPVMFMPVIMLVCILRARWLDFYAAHPTIARRVSQVEHFVHDGTSLLHLHGAKPKHTRPETSPCPSCASR